MNSSLTLTGLFTIILGFVLQEAGIEVTDTQVGNFVVVLIQIVGMAAVYWGRFRHGDINFFGKKDGKY